VTNLDHRYYSSGPGRFLTPDPYMASVSGANDPTEPKSWNRYVYASGDPINGRDPRGLETCFFVDGVLDSCEADDSPGRQRDSGSNGVQVAEALAANKANMLLDKGMHHMNTAGPDDQAGA
jgi:RHS repeat-associated protein